MALPSSRQAVQNFPSFFSQRNNHHIGDDAVSFSNARKGSYSQLLFHLLLSCKMSPQHKDRNEQRAKSQTTILARGKVGVTRSPFCPFPPPPPPKKKCNFFVPWEMGLNFAERRKSWRRLWKPLLQYISRQTAASCTYMIGCRREKGGPFMKTDKTVVSCPNREGPII